MTALTVNELPEQAARELAWSYDHLEHPSLAARLSDALASPIGKAMTVLPREWKQRIDRSAETSVQRTLNLALGSLGKDHDGPARLWQHKLAVAGTGAIGGFFGPFSTLAELPVATTLMMRSIADVARSQGEDLQGSAEARMACAQVFALGGRTKADEDAELGYYGMRLTLGLHLERVVQYAGKVEASRIPGLIQLTRAIATRFGVVISDKLAAQLVPVAGALGGATLNLIFMQHYQDIARGHFIVRRLEREYGVDRIRDAYHRLRLAELSEARVFSPLEGW